MPLYAYRCKKCGAEEEHLQKLNDDPMTECSTCGGELARLITGVSFSLKGGGWYADGYGSSKPSDAGGDKGASTGGDKGSGGGGDAGGDKPKKTEGSTKAANE